MQSACKLVTNTFVYRVRGRSELISHCSGLFCLFFFNYFFGNYRQAVLKHNQSPFKSTPSASRTREGIPALPTVGCAGRALLAPCWVSSALPPVPIGGCIPLSLPEILHFKINSLTHQWPSGSPRASNAVSPRGCSLCSGPRCVRTLHY